MTAGRGCCRAGLKATPHLFSEGDGKPGQPRGESKAGYGTPDTRAAELDTRENFLEEATLTSRSAGKREANQQVICKCMNLETKEQTEARVASERKWSEEWEGGRSGR